MGAPTADHEPGHDSCNRACRDDAAENAYCDRAYPHFVLGG
jgi:hypothetical protein